MKTFITLPLICLCLTCCTHEDGRSSSHTSPDKGVDQQADPDQAWAQSLLEQSADWDPVTPGPVSTVLKQYTLCRPPLPPRDANGPHDRTALNPETMPANQFVVNPLARRYFYQSSDGPQSTDPLPVGSTIVKEKYDDIADAPERKHASAIAIMIKREKGYSPDHGDWEYGYIELNDDGGLMSITRGKIASCIDCHANRSKTDYIYRNYLLLPIDH